MKRKQVMVSAILIASGAGVAFGDPASLEVFSDFEEFSPNTPIGGTFDIGGANFSGSGSFAGFLGEPELYFSGIRAWMVQGESFAHISFAEGASVVEFWAIADPEATADATVAAFDFDGNQIGMTQSIVVGEAFSLYHFDGDISFIEFDHTAAANVPTGMISIDDFGYNSVPTPASGALLLIGGGLLSRRRR